MKSITCCLILLIAFSAKAQIVSGSLEEATCYFPPSPEFPGGMDSLFTFINNNITWAQSQTTVQGKVYVQFTVNEKGVVSNVKLVKGLYKPCDLEALLVVKTLPKWKPVMIDGTPQKTKMMIPISFEL